MKFFKIAFPFLLLSIFVTESFAVRVRGYRKKNGTYVSSYHRSKPHHHNHKHRKH